MFFYYLSIAVLSYFLSRYFTLYNRKEKVRQLIQRIWENSYMANDKAFGEYYIANAGIYYAKVFDPITYSRQLGFLSLYGAISLIMAALGAFFYGPLNIITIEGVVVAALIFLTGTSRFYSFNIAPDLLLESLSQNYFSYTNNSLIKTNDILRYNQFALEITQDAMPQNFIEE